MHTTDSRRSDILIGAILLAFCVFAAWRTSLVPNVPTGTVAGPAFVPWAMIGGVGALSLVMIGRALLRYSAGNPDSPIEMPRRATLVRMALFALLMIVYATVFMEVGYLWSTWIAFTIGLLLFGERRILVLALVPTAITFAIYYAFTQWLGVWLP